MKNESLGSMFYTFVCGLTASTPGQQPTDKPKVDLVTVVGCASRSADKAWILTNPTEPKVIKAAATTRKEIEDVEPVASQLSELDRCRRPKTWRKND